MSKHETWRTQQCTQQRTQQYGGEILRNGYLLEEFRAVSANAQKLRA